MAAIHNTTRCDSDSDRVKHEDFLEALQNCDEMTYREIISILTKAGLLPA